MASVALRGILGGAVCHMSGVQAIAAAYEYSMALISDPPVSMLNNPRLQDRVFSASVETETGKTYRLEYKTSLTDTEWTPLPWATGTGANLTLTDSSPGGSVRFYRASSE